GSHDGIGPGTDVEGRRAAPELLPRVRREAEHPAGAGAVLVIDVVAAQGQAEGRAEVVRDPAAEGPPLRILRGIRQRRVGLLPAVVALYPQRRFAELAPQQPVDAVAIAVLLTASSGPQNPTTPIAVSASG